MSNVSSTRPSARAPKRRRRPKRPSLSVVAAVLGVIATLWATLVGKTVPDLVRDKDAAVTEFRAEVDAVCERGIAISRDRRIHLPPTPSLRTRIALPQSSVEPLVFRVI